MIADDVEGNGAQPTTVARLAAMSAGGALGTHKHLLCQILISNELQHETVHRSLMRNHHLVIVFHHAVPRRVQRICTASAA